MLLVPGWSNYTSLAALLLGNNSISGQLPEAWGSSGNFRGAVKFLHIDNNNLTGSVPESWKNMFPDCATVFNNTYLCGNYSTTGGLPCLDTFGTQLGKHCFLFFSCTLLACPRFPVDGRCLVMTLLGLCT
jgi:hypothetical protein